ncbi:DUF1543 domain-containing protein [Chryseobacterium sp. SN22]|uniref:DUF1543 domain-containing protein n=1 Tax=Chryseobacterium sp. SN22 TaxID=2606431 RepID=UPI0011EDCFC2|nr:DUF1543 domain-containing protein [Chryseobacterium sp. SN22]KAA0128078.1 DUF1543 domain-containing protein [Chryseobacterium sp. SN22]
MKLFYVILGATPPGRNIEQHDVFFGIAESLKDLVEDMKAFWKEAKGKIHIDCYQEVKFVDGYEVQIVERGEATSEEQLYFINLGGYKRGHFEEFHEQHLVVGNSMSDAVKKAKSTEFYKTMGFKGATSHIDEKLGVDIDDIFPVKEILPSKMKQRYAISLVKSEAENQENFVSLGYLKIDKIK